jgi:hypothetical protein
MKPSKSTTLFTDTNVLLLLGLALFLLHMFTNHQYGFHQDELIVLDNAMNLDWGYIEYPPLTPFLARIELTLFGFSLVSARTFAALTFSIVLVIAGLVARELGGGRSAQVLAALAVSIAPFALIQGALMQYVDFDFLWTVLIAYFVIRLLKSENPRWWLAIGAVIGLGMMTKYTMVMFVAGLVGGVLLTDARRYLKSPWLWGGVALSLLIFLPNLIWQILHDFISLEFLSSIHARDVEIGRAASYIPEQFFSNANPFVLPIWIAGLIYYFRGEAGRRYRMIGWMYIIPFFIYLFSQGRAYYLAGAYPMLMAAGVVVWQRWLERMSAQKARVLTGATSAGIALGALMGAALALPLAPINSGWWNLVSEAHDTFTEQIGWRDMVETVSGIYAGLPEEEKARAGILTAENDEAAALNLYGPDYDLPKAISGCDTFWLRGPGNPPPETLIIVGYTSEEVNPAFEQCTLAGEITNSYGVENDLREPPDIFICRQPVWSWDEFWRRVKHYS